MIQALDDRVAYSYFCPVWYFQHGQPSVAYQHAKDYMVQYFVKVLESLSWFFWAWDVFANLLFNLTLAKLLFKETVKILTKPLTSYTMNQTKIWSLSLLFFWGRSRDLWKAKKIFCFSRISNEILTKQIFSYSNLRQPVSIDIQHGGSLACIRGDTHGYRLRR